MARSGKKKTSRDPKPAPDKTTAPKKASASEEKGGIIMAIREWLDALVLAYLLAMFIRLFVAELFKIPSPSMTPTLLGTSPQRQEISFYDVNDDGRDDMILHSILGGESFDVYIDDGDRYVFAGKMNPGPHRSSWLRDRQQRQDRILVAKFAYWFSEPDRGDIAIFKVPDSIYEKTKPIYIKRVVGLPGEELAFLPVPGVPGHQNSMGRLMVDGELVEEPEFFQKQIYEYGRIGNLKPYEMPEYARYRNRGIFQDLMTVKVPEDSVYVFGDNTVSSRDSRYWGAVPFNHLRGKAILRYWKSPKFLP
ncbi:MAG: signal peptidase I [Candidatus Sumerlaeia bacterium]